MNIYFGIDVASEKHNCCIIDQNEHVLHEFTHLYVSEQPNQKMDQNVHETNP